MATAPKTKEQVGRAARNKGARGERQVRDIFRAFGFETVRRGHVFDHESDVIGAPGIHIEVKYQKTAKIWKWIGQAEMEAKIKNDGQPVIWFRKDFEPWRVIVPAKLFMEMYEAWYREQISNETGVDV